MNKKNRFKLNHLNQINTMKHLHTTFYLKNLAYEKFNFRVIDFNIDAII